MEQKSHGVKDEMFEWLLAEMRAAQANGVPVSVDGKIYSVGDADELREVMEDHYYMKSYVGDDSGRIIRIDFDHITDI